MCCPHHEPFMFTHYAEETEPEEAEYAWLPLDCIKPFRFGDVSGVDGGAASSDPALKASVAQAEGALRASGQHLTAASRAAALAATGDMEAAAAAREEAIIEEAEFQSDSDGGGLEPYVMLGSGLWACKKECF